MKNLGIKLIALALACVLWFFVSAPRRERVRERIVTAPISLVGLRNEFIITTEITGSVAVRVRGRMSDLRALAVQTLEVPIDLSWVQQAGEISITLRPQAINVPPEIEVVSIEPNKVRFRIEQLRQRTVAIRPFLAGDVPAGYLVGTATNEPERALVSGPASQILKLNEVATERIIMTGRTATFSQNVAVVSDSPLVRVISPLTTQVTVPVLPEIGPNVPPDATTSSETSTDSMGDTTGSTATSTSTTSERKPPE
ncbi:MAG TPA: CdaR family protein [Thermoanaerobaculia bacterium]|nr:CdaR family protein [Thermoanaerobaculia bacterium]